MESAILLLLGMCAGWGFAHWIGGKRAAPAITDALLEKPDDNETLAIRLHRIDEAFEPFARNASHANELATHPEFRKAVELLADPQTPLTNVSDYAFGQTWTLSCAAFAALKERPDGAAVAIDVPARFESFAVWQMRFALQFLVAASPRLPAGAPLIGYKDWWNDSSPIQHAFADYFAALGTDDTAEPGPDVAALPLTTRQQIKAFLGRIRHPTAARLSDKLADATTGSDQTSTFLASLGRLWGSEGDAAILLEPDAWKSALNAAEQIVGRTRARALLISGDSLVGKTSFLRLLEKRLGPKGWRVLEASGADLQAGQFYIGQLEGRIREVLEELDVAKKVIWYVPDLLSLAMSGTHQGQSASILDQILPSLTSGRVLVWTEATPASMARLLQLRPALRRIFEIVRLDEMPEEETLALAGALAAQLTKRSGRLFDAGFSQTAVDVAQHYLSAASLPGSALALMKMTAQRSEKRKGQPFTGQDVLATLSQVTGLPLSLLDGAERLDLASIRDFFASRVIGQPEAVACVVERIAMLKSGLNDPAKPIGVFLFAGPTGTGKTELAKTVAEYLFGSADRMIRLDMSEYQTQESVSKILGGAGLPPDADTLVARIRKQPFSLVLLDEFEKSHSQIWDLFLQVFDEGRLSDALGHTADFRYSLIILTTNLGATAHRDRGLGFTPSLAGFTNEQVLRSIGQTFRPEFQNRLDKVIVFKPLTRELMRGILNKELERIFERRGLKDRAWAVEWDATALEFLLEKGFSPEMGARPLKRAIDQYVIAPMAETIVERRFPEGDQFVFVRRDGGELRADFVDPDGDGEPAKPAAAAAPATSNSELPSLFQMMRAPSGDSDEIAALAAAQEPIAARIDASEWTELKARLSSEINAPEFWSRPDRFATLTSLELMDRLAVAAETARSLQTRLARRNGATGKSVRELTSRIAMQIHLVNEGLKDLDERAPVEVALIVEPVFVTGTDDSQALEAWRQEIASMYGSWARNRNMNSAEIDGVPGISAPALLVAGFGAHRTLSREVGLHVLEGGEPANASGRITARVLLATLPLGNLSKATIRQGLADAFGKAARPAAIVRRYRRSPAPLVRNADGSWRSGKVEDVLRGDFDVLAHEMS